MAAGDILALNGSLTPARTCCKFIGTGDQAFVVDLHASDRVTAGDTAGTYSAWINIPNITGNYGIVSCGDTAAIEFITLSVKTGKLNIECNDATDDQFEHITTAVVFEPHKWYHVAVVQDATLNAPKLYVDGVVKATTATLATDNAAWFGQCQLIDNGSIGAAEEAGAAQQIKECVGAISDVKYWNAALTAAQIYDDFAGVPNTTNLTDYWKMGGLTNEANATNVGVKGASILIVDNYSEFTSKVAHSGVVVADEISISMNERLGSCIVVKAA